jgi:queuine tRNA-ribosyltransferase
LLDLPHGRLRLPAFLPDATRGGVRAVDATDLERCGVQGLQMNVFHLMQRPGSSTVKSLGGLHRMSGWSKPIATDSGGFQIYSLIRQDARFGRVTGKGLLFRPDSARAVRLTPEKSIQLQMSYGADLLICLDHCTHADESLSAQQESVDRTVAWARRCREEYVRQIEQRRLAPDSRPLLFAVIQGGRELELRKRCAGELLDMGFDGYGLGGWPLDAEGRLLLDVIAYTRTLIPPDLPMHALGVGQPANVVACAKEGYNLFDSTMPTRDARRGRLYVFAGDPRMAALRGEWYSYLYIADAKHTKAVRPVAECCDCLCCTNSSLAYLHHLFKVGDPLYQRLATVHNLRFMTQLMGRLRVDKNGG